MWSSSSCLLISALYKNNSLCCSKVNPEFTSVELIEDAPMADDLVWRKPISIRCSFRIFFMFSFSPYPWHLNLKCLAIFIKCSPNTAPKSNNLMQENRCHHLGCWGESNSPRVRRERDQWIWASYWGRAHQAHVQLIPLMTLQLVPPRHKQNTRPRHLVARWRGHLTRKSTEDN